MADHNQEHSAPSPNHANAPRNRLAWRFLMLCAVLGTCHIADGLTVESGYVGLDVSQKGMSLSFGPKKIIVSGDFYLANRDWKPLFPDASAYEITRTGPVVTKRTRKNAVITAEIVHTVREDGVKVDITAEIPPNSGAHFAVWDIFLAKPMFAMATVNRTGQRPVTLDPTNWKTRGADNLTLSTASGNWSFKVTTDNAAGWKLRSVCDSTWLPEEKKTFTLIHLLGNVPAEGLKEKLSFEARFVPKPGYLATVERQYAEKAASYLEMLLARYGSLPSCGVDQGHILTSPSQGGQVGSKEPVRQAGLLAKKLCEASAHLDPSRLDPRAAVVIPEPKSYQKGTGVFAVPSVFDIACSTDHDVPLELLAADLSRLGVKVRRVESSAKAPFAMGVSASDSAVAKACARLGVEVSDRVRGPEAYTLVVTPNEVLLAGSDDAGVLYGAQTLRQLVRSAPNGAEIPAVSITDRPDMKFRGFYVEGAGTSANSEELRRLIRDTYGYCKANAVVLQLRWNNFRWRTHPELAPPNALPVDDLIAIARYARRYVSSQ